MPENLEATNKKARRQLEHKLLEKSTSQFSPQPGSSEEPDMASTNKQIHLSNYGTINELTKFQDISKS